MGRSPQWRSSSTSSSGPRRALGAEEVLEGAAHLVAHEHGVLPRGAELRRSCRRGRARRRSRRGTRGSAARSSPVQMRATADAPQLPLPRTPSGSPWCNAGGAAERLRRAARRPSRALSGSPRPSPDLRRAGGRSRRRCSSSSRRRDLPTPGGAVTSTARGHRLVDALVEEGLERGAARGRGRRRAWACRAACARPRLGALAAELEAGGALADVEARSSSRPRGHLVDADRRRAPAPVWRSIAAARSMTSPIGQRSATTPRPVASDDRARRASARRSASAQRAACAAWSVATLAPESVTTTEPSASCSSLALVGRSHRR